MFTSCMSNCPFQLSIRYSPMIPVRLVRRADLQGHVGQNDFTISGYVLIDRRVCKDSWRPASSQDGPIETQSDDRSAPGNCPIAVTNLNSMLRFSVGGHGALL